MSPRAATSDRMSVEAMAIALHHSRATGTVKLVLIGIANHDGRIMASRGPVEVGGEGVLDFIRNWPEIKKSLPANQQKFCLVISLVNPHDVLAYPRRYAAGGYSNKWLQGDMKLPDTVAERLVTKPKAQAIFKALVASGTGPLPSTKAKINYLNFYANLMKVSDNYLTNVLAAMRAVGYDAEEPANSQFGLLGETLVVRTADHGEMGLTHGNMIQKSFNFYEETIRIPMIWSNPKLYKRAFQTDALVSHIDLLPTLASLFSAPDSAKAAWQGVDYSSLVLNPNAKPVQDEIIFTYDDWQSGQASGPYIPPPQHIVSFREKRWKFAEYWDATGDVPSEFEMYDLKTDPLETVNIAHASYDRTPAQDVQFLRLMRKLQTIKSTRLQPL